jgi:ubiquitin-like protein 5
VVCSSNDTVGQLKKMVAAQTGTKAEKIRIQKWLVLLSLPFNGSCRVA